MARKWRDLYAERVKGAIPEEHQLGLYKLAKEEEDRELLVREIVEELSKKRGRVGAPRKTADDTNLAEDLLAKHSGNHKLARQEFVKIITARDGIEKSGPASGSSRRWQRPKNRSGFSAV
jgi:hypothetical protein